LSPNQNLLIQIHNWKTWASSLFNNQSLYVIYVNIIHFSHWLRSETAAWLERITKVSDLQREFNKYIIKFCYCFTSSSAINFKYMLNIQLFRVFSLFTAVDNPLNLLFNLWFVEGFYWCCRWWCKHIHTRERLCAVVVFLLCCITT
jgi:hypothetical protein